MAKMEKWVYLFGGKKTDGDRKMKSILGGKGANLAEMSLMGLPVPPGFTVSTEACAYYNDNDQHWPDQLPDHDILDCQTTESQIVSKPP